MAAVLATVLTALTAVSDQEDSASVASAPGSNAWTNLVAENSKKLRGAALEIGDVNDSLAQVEQVESRVERDLRLLLSAFSRNASSTSGSQTASPSLDSGRLANLFGLSTRSASRIEEAPGHLAVALGEHLSNMRRDLASLVTTINATRLELAEAREAVGSTERALEEARYAERRAKIAERLRDGKATVDYETGEVSTLLSPSERRRIGLVLGTANLSRIETQFLEESLGLRRDGSSRHSARRFDRERQRADPAMLHLDTRFLQDIVVLSLSTALGGLLAAALGAPYTLGNMLGGVVVGPSCLDLVRNLEQTETLAQFGSIFLLFSHGLMYSRIYGGGSASKRRRNELCKGFGLMGEDDEPETSLEASVDASEAPPASGTAEVVSATVVDGSALDHGDEQIVDDVATSEAVEVGGHALSSGFALVLGLGLAFAFSSRLAGVAAGPAEAALYSAAFSLSSSNTVLSTLREARLDDSVFGRAVVELLSVQDLVLAPLFAMPTAISELAYGSKQLARRPLDLAWVITTYSVLIIVVVLAARRVLPRALGALGAASVAEAQAPHDYRVADFEARPRPAAHWSPVGDTRPPLASDDDTAHARRRDRTRLSRRELASATTPVHRATSLQHVGASPLPARHGAVAKNASLGLCVIGYALAMALLADRLKLSHEAGALFAGLVLVGTPHVEKAKRAIEPLTSLFGGMYIASLGLVASPKYLLAHSLPLLATVSAVLLLKLSIVAPLVYGLGFSRVAALAAGVVFGQVSEVSLFVAARAHRLHLVERGTYLDVLSSTVVLLAIAPVSVPLVRRVDRKHFYSLEKRELRRDSSKSALPSRIPNPRGCPSLVACLVKTPFRCATNVLFAAKRRFSKKPR